jgi:hypothetical protein
VDERAWKMLGVRDAAAVLLEIAPKKLYEEGDIILFFYFLSSSTFQIFSFLHPN